MESAIKIIYFLFHLSAMTPAIGTKITNGMNARNAAIDKIVLLFGAKSVIVHIITKLTMFEPKIENNCPVQKNKYA